MQAETKTAPRERAEPGGATYQLCTSADLPPNLPPGHPHIVFSSLETLIDALSGYAARTVSVDGVEATGIVRPWKRHLYTKNVYMIGLYDVLSDELVAATDIRNLAMIAVL